MTASIEMKSSESEAALEGEMIEARIILHIVQQSKGQDLD